MQVEILTIGTELLRGSRLNMNALYLARRLKEIGLSVGRHTTVCDERTLLLDALRQALRRSDILITTGGLGPTFDDITMEAIGKVIERPMIFNKSAAEIVRRFYSRHHRTLCSAALRQAYMPYGARALPNQIGTAPGIWLQLSGQILIALPGVPREMQIIMERYVIPRLKRLPDLACAHTVTLRTIGVVELHIEQMLRRMRLSKSVEIGLYPNLHAVDINITAYTKSRRASREAVSRAASALKRKLGSSVYGTDNDTLEGEVGRLLTRNGKTLSLAESCTGGLLSNRLTNIPGSSRYLLGTVVAYHNTLKRLLLQVPSATLAQSGAVSAAVARRMAEGIRRSSAADIGLAVTGIAGPGGATPGKPVGLVFFGLANARGTKSLRRQFIGDRLSIKNQAAQTALDWLRLHLLNTHR